MTPELLGQIEELYHLVREHRFMNEPLCSTVPIRNCGTKSNLFSHTRAIV